LERSLFAGLSDAAPLFAAGELSAELRSRRRLFSGGGEAEAAES